MWGIPGAENVPNLIARERERGRGGEGWVQGMAQLEHEPRSSEAGWRVVRAGGGGRERARQARGAGAKDKVAHVR